MEFSSSNVDNIPYILFQKSFFQVFSKKKNISSISKSETLDIPLQPPKNLKNTHTKKMRLSSSNIKKIVIFF